MAYRGLIFDIDNTLVHHGDPSNEKVDGLFRRLHAMGFKTVLLTDNDEPRVKELIANIDTPYVADAEKPDPRGYREAVEKLGVDKEQAIVIGDQMFTDIRGANGFGLASILVHYIVVPGVTRIGKKRYVERALLFLYRHSKRHYRRLGSIEKSPEGGVAR